VMDTLEPANPTSSDDPTKFDQAAGPRLRAIADELVRARTFADKSPRVFSEAKTAVTMKQLIAGMVLAGLMTGSAEAQTQVGRYQIVTAPPAQSQLSPEVYLLDTTTGQAWTLFETPGQATEWLPLRYWAGQGRPMAPLPPSPDTIGPANRR